jgi:hypothetical protein
MLDEVELARPMGNHASLKPRRRQRKGKKLQARRYAPRDDKFLQWQHRSILLSAAQLCGNP